MEHGADTAAPAMEVIDRPSDVIGRAMELATVEAFVQRAATGLAGLRLEGEAGIGKTTIFDAAVAEATAAGFRVLRARPAESERDLTLASLTDIFANVEDRELASLPAPQRRGLQVALLRTEQGDAPPTTDQRTLSVAVTGLLRDLAGAGTPVLLAIDDAQWLDDSCRAILAYAARRLAGRHLGILLSLRNPEPADPGLAALLTALPATTERIVVGPMPLASLHLLLKARLGRSLPRVALVRIEEASGGNPFYALEMARALLKTGASLAPAEAVPLPPTLAGLGAGRIGGLPPATRKALLLAATALEPTVEAIRSADPGAMEAMEPAIVDGIIGIGGGFVRFSHPLLAQAVIGSATQDEVRAAHALLATSAPGGEARARHAGQAATQRDELVASDLERAAAVARSRGAALDAASLYELAARLTPEALADETTQRLRLAAECLFVDISEVVQADALLERAIAAARPGPARAEALSLRAIVRYYHGVPPAAVELGRQAVAEVGREPLLRARVLVRLAFLLAQQDVEEALQPLEEAIATLDTADAGALEPDLVANALLLRASLCFGLVRRVDPEDVERGEQLISGGGRSWEHDNADGLLFGLARHTDDLDRAIGMTEELIRSKSGAAGDDPFNLVQLSGLLCLRGDLPGARRTAEAAAEGYAREGSGLIPSWPLRGLALVAAHDGRADEARALATEGLELALADGNLVIATMHQHILGFVALSLGQYLEAYDRLTAAAQLANRTANRHPGRFKLDGDLIDAALALGRHDEAAAAVTGLEQALQIVPTPWVRVVAARCQGLLDAARGDLDAAVVALDRALVAQEVLPMPFERGRTLLARGQVHRRRKEKRLADEALRDALAVFESLGTPIWADRARAELARVGRRPRAPQTLTDTERSVAELAAAGMATPRIAERVFLSPKTVGNVLGRVYQKLGIHSRAELGALMAREGEAPGDRLG